MHSIHHVLKVPGCCRQPKQLHSLWSHLSGNFIVDVVNVVVSLWVVNVATLPPYCLFVASAPMVYCCFFDCIGQNEVMRLRKNGNDAMIFNASYLNDHNVIWNVGHTVGKV